MSSRKNRLASRRRAMIFSRKQELKDLRERKDADLAVLLDERLRPFVREEVARQCAEYVQQAVARCMFEWLKTQQAQESVPSNLIVPE